MRRLTTPRRGRVGSQRGLGAWGTHRAVILAWPAWLTLPETDGISHFAWVFLWRVLQSKLIFSNTKNKILFCSYSPIKNIFKFLSFIFFFPTICPTSLKNVLLKKISNLLFHPSLCLAQMSPVLLKCLSPTLPVTVLCVVQGPAQISSFPSRFSSFPSTGWDPSLCYLEQCISLTWQLYPLMPFHHPVLPLFPSYTASIVKTETMFIHLGISIADPFALDFIVQSLLSSSSWNRALCSGEKN